MRESNQLRLFSRDRPRQFRDVRRSHSRLASLSQSQISKSVGKSRLEKSVINDRECSRISNFENDDSRVLRQSKICPANQQSKLRPGNQQSKSHNNLMCVCCYNKKQAQVKRNRRQRQHQQQEEQMIQMKQSMIQQNLHKQLAYQNHIRQNVYQVNEYNKKLIQRHQKQRQEEQRRKNQQDQQLRINKMQLERQKQNRLRNYQQQKNQLKEKYQEQIKIKKQKQNQMKKYNQTHDNYVIDSIIPQNPASKSAIDSIKAAYKQDLLKQIEFKQQQKKNQIQNYKGISPQKSFNQFDLVTFAQKRNQQARKIAQKIKADNLKEINQKRNMEMVSKQQKQKQRIQKQNQRKQILYEQHIERQKEEEMRRKKIDNYLCDLKSQIEENKRKRLQQLQWINQRKQVEPIIRVNQVPESDKQSCQGCHKKYPKKLLSQFVAYEE